MPRLTRRAWVGSGRLADVTSHVIVAQQPLPRSLRIGLVGPTSSEVSAGLATFFAQRRNEPTLLIDGDAPAWASTQYLGVDPVPFPARMLKNMSENVTTEDVLRTSLPFTKAGLGVIPIDPFNILLNDAAQHLVALGRLFGLQCLDLGRSKDANILGPLDAIIVCSQANKRGEDVARRLAEHYAYANPRLLIALSGGTKSAVRAIPISRVAHEIPVHTLPSPSRRFHTTLTEKTLKGPYVEALSVLAGNTISVTERTA